MAKTKPKRPQGESGDLAVRVDPATAREIRRMAKEKDQTVSKYIRRMIERAMGVSK